LKKKGLLIKENGKFSFMILKKVIWFIVFLLSVSIAFAEAPKLKIITTESSPFVMQYGDNIEGFAVDLLRRISEICQFEYTLTIKETIPDVYNIMKENNADLAIGGFPMSLKYEHFVDYTYPVFKSGSQIMTMRSQHPGAFGKYLGGFIGALFSLDVLKVILSLFLLLFLSANIVWFAERKNNPTMFPKNYMTGIWESFWWSSVTVTTVGYGDKTPKSLVGRLCALVWMFAGIFVISYFTATISSSHTVSKLENKYNSPHDLIGKQVGSVKGSTVSRYLKTIGVRLFEFNSIDIAYKALQKNLITAVVYDAPVLRYYVQKDSQDRYILGSREFKKKNYGFLLPANSPHEESINRAIIFLQETGEFELIYEKWFGVQ